MRNKVKELDVRHSCNSWLTEEDINDVKKEWKGKGIVTVDRFNDGTIDRIHIKVPKVKIVEQRK